MNIPSLAAFGRGRQAALPKLSEDIAALDQPDQILTALDAYRTAKERRSSEIWTGSGLLLTASSNVYSTIQAVFDTCQKCRDSEPSFTARLACGLAEANIISSSLGLGGLGVSIKMLYNAHISLSEAVKRLDDELNIKLNIPRDFFVSRDDFQLDLVKRFARLTDSSQDKLRGEVAERADRVVIPEIVR